MVVLGVVEAWDDGEGWGLVRSDDLGGTVSVSYSVIDSPFYRHLIPGEAVILEAVASGDGGEAFVATWLRRTEDRPHDLLVAGDSVQAERDATPADDIQIVQRELFWSDRERLQGLPIGTSFEREYRRGEFFTPWVGEDEPTEEVRFAETERVIVWLVDLFREPTRTRGYIRARQPIPGPPIVVHDGEDAVSWLFRAGPPRSR